MYIVHVHYNYTSWFLVINNRHVFGGGGGGKNFMSMVASVRVVLDDQYTRLEQVHCVRGFNSLTDCITDAKLCAIPKWGDRLALADGPSAEWSYLSHEVRGVHACTFCGLDHIASIN